MKFALVIKNVPKTFSFITFARNFSTAPRQLKLSDQAVPRYLCDNLGLAGFYHQLHSSHNDGRKSSFSFIQL